MRLCNFFLSGPQRTLRFSSTKSFVEGRATRIGTQTYIAKTKLPLYHCLHKTSLYLNPTIASHPIFCIGPNDETQYRSYLHASTTLKSNCFSIYNNNGIDKEWYFTDIQRLLNETKLKRENIILIANIAISIYPGQDIEAQIERIKKLCKVSFIDIIMLETDRLTYEYNTHNFEYSINRLEDLCEKKESIQTFGLHTNIAPFCYHTPAATKMASVGMQIPIQEDAAKTKYHHLDIMMYPISVTTHFPATYMMLDPSEDEDLPTPEDQKGDEKDRVLTRIAYNPLLGYYGGGVDSRLDNKAKSLLDNYIEQHQMDKRSLKLKEFFDKHPSHLQDITDDVIQKREIDMDKAFRHAEYTAILDGNYDNLEEKSSDLDMKKNMKKNSSDSKEEGGGEEDDEDLPSLADVTKFEEILNSHLKSSNLAGATADDDDEYEYDKSNDDDDKLLSTDSDELNNNTSISKDINVNTLVETTANLIEEVMVMINERQNISEIPQKLYILKENVNILKQEYYNRFQYIPEKDRMTTTSATNTSSTTTGGDDDNDDNEEDEEEDESEIDEESERNINKLLKKQNMSLDQLDNNDTMEIQTINIPLSIQTDINQQISTNEDERIDKSTSSTSSIKDEEYEEIRNILRQFDESIRILETESIQQFEIDLNKFETYQSSFQKDISQQEIDVEYESVTTQTVTEIGKTLLSAEDARIQYIQEIIPILPHKREIAHKMMQILHLKSMNPRVDGIELVSGVNPYALESEISMNLHECCPELEDTIRIEEKIIRSILAIGYEAYAVDSLILKNISQVIDLKPSDLLTSEELDDMYGYFKLIDHDEEIEKEKEEKSDKKVGYSSVSIQQQMEQEIKKKRQMSDKDGFSTPTRPRHL